MKKAYSDQSIGFNVFYPKLVSNKIGAESLLNGLKMIQTILKNEKI